MSLVLVVIGLFCCDSIGWEDSGVFRHWSVVVLLFVRPVVCMMQVIVIAQVVETSVNINKSQQSVNINSINIYNSLPGDYSQPDDHKKH